MAVNNFIPTIWSARLLQNLHKTQVFGGLSNRDYEGEIAQAGDTVKIGGIGAVTVSDYTKNSTSLSWQTLADASQTLTIDQAKYFAFKVDDVDRAQTKPDLMDEAMREAAYALSDEIDGYIAALYGSAATANKVGSDGSAVTVGYGSGETDPYHQLVDMGTKLTVANVPQAGRWAVVPPWFEGMLRKNANFVANPASGSGESVVTNGLIGRVANFDIYVSNNVTDNGSGVYRCMFGSRMAISLAVQKQPQMEAIRLQDSFADGVRGLLLYGAKVVRPAALAVLFADEGANA